MTISRAGGRKKLAPDPLVHTALLAAASEVVREDGVRALSIAAVLGRAELGTRAFYRHFDCKDQLVSAVFLEMAQAEVVRLRQRMTVTPDPVRAVAAWIDARLDLAFNEDIRSDLRRMSLEAQNQMSAAPELVAPAYREILRPLVEELTRGRDLGLFADIDPDSEALSIHGVVWSNVERHWATAGVELSGIRARVGRFCLRGLGVAPKAIATALGELNAGKF
jgi:AcrR family transcriptional regulator